MSAATPTDLLDRWQRLNAAVAATPDDDEADRLTATADRVVDALAAAPGGVDAARIKLQVLKVRAGQGQPPDEMSPFDRANYDLLASALADLDRMAAGGGQ